MALTFIPQKSTCLATGTFGRSCQGSDLDPAHLLITSKLKYNRFFVPKQNLGAFSAGLRLQNDPRRKMDFAVYSSAKQESQLPADSSSDTGKAWILGTIMAIILFISSNKWGPLLKLKDKVEPKIQTMENVAEAVEGVAGIFEEVAKKVAACFPNGKPHDAALFFKKLFKGLRKGAHIAEEELKQVEEVENKVESLLESTTHQGDTVTTTETKDRK